MTQSTEDKMTAKVFTPRKKTAVNAGMLPSDFNEEKRVTYITINTKQTQIEEALREYFMRRIPMDPDADFTIDFTNGRGDSGISAEVVLKTPDIAAVPAPKHDVGVVDQHIEGFSESLERANDLNASRQQFQEEPEETAPEPEPEEDTVDDKSEPEEQEPFEEEDLTDEAEEATAEELLNDVEEEPEAPAPAKKSGGLFGNKTTPEKEPEETSSAEIEKPKPSEKRGGIFKSMS